MAPTEAFGFSTDGSRSDDLRKKFDLVELAGVFGPEGLPKGSSRLTALDSMAREPRDVPTAAGEFKTGLTTLSASANLALTGKSVSSEPIIQLISFRYDSRASSNISRSRWLRR